MTKRCRHELEKKVDYPEDTICQKCQTIWRIPDYLNWTSKELMSLPKQIRYEVLEWQAKKFNQENPDYYLDSEVESRLSHECLS